MPSMKDGIGDTAAGDGRREAPDQESHAGAVCCRRSGMRRTKTPRLSPRRSCPTSISKSWLPQAGCSKAFCTTRPSRPARPRIISAASFRLPPKSRPPTANGPAIAVTESRKAARFEVTRADMRRSAIRWAWCWRRSSRKRRRQAILIRAADYAYSREVCGDHYHSDARRQAGRWARRSEPCC